MVAQHNGNAGERSISGSAILTLFLIVLMVLYIVFTDYSNLDQNDVFDSTNFELRYGWFMDVHVMVFIGFGFLMTYLKYHGYSSVGFNFLVASLAFLWSVLTNSFFHQLMGFRSNGAYSLSPMYKEASASGSSKVFRFLWAENESQGFTIGGKTLYDPTTMSRLYEDDAVHHGFHYVSLSVDQLITSDFTAAACLVSFGAVLGKASPTQLVVMVFFECIFFAINESIGIHLQVVDMGGSMFVHLFGAIFGVAMTFTLTSDEQKKQAKSRQIGAKYSDLFAMVGTVFLFIFWPSFNGALAVGKGRHRVVINSVIALCGSCMTTFIISSVTRKNKKFLMEHVQNAALAGGVAIGSSADLIVQPWGALLIGTIGGAVSTLGFAYAKGFLEKKCGIHDTCGVLHLHGVPGLIGGLGGSISSVAAGAVTPFCSVYPATAPSWEAIVQSMKESNSTAALFGLLSDECDPGTGRSANEQAGYQFAAAVITVAIAAVSGLCTGAIMRLSIFSPVREAFTDGEYWELEDDDCEADISESSETVELRSSA